MDSFGFRECEVRLYMESMWRWHRVVWGVATNFRVKEAYCNEDSAKIN